MNGDYKLYLVENMDENSCDKLDNAVIAAKCQDEIKEVVNEEWPELLRLEIIELSQVYVNQLMEVFPEEKILCKGVTLEYKKDGVE